mgnify:CR=1 FL=1|tara:strand:- start:374 stop:592 length:219 start_codon:yes stop_codon:yes gene_type:complete
MRVGDIIKHLEKYDADDSIVIAWWDRDSFDPDSVHSPSLDWESACSFMDAIDWSNIHDELEQALETFLEVEE